ncbi:hypothetical protein MTO96_038376 [Rhipicephalus appendiculatus]
MRIFGITHFEEVPNQSYINLSTIFSEATTEPPLKTFIREDTMNNCLRYKVLLESENIPYDVFTDILGTLRAKYQENFFESLSTYAFGSAFNKTEIEMWTSPLDVLGSSIQQNLIDTVLLREQTGQPNVRDINKKNPLYDVLQSIMYSWAFWGLLLPMSIGLITSTFVLLPSMEVCNEARQLQLMTVVLLLIVFFSAPVYILLPYLVSELSADSGMAYAIVLGLFAVGG